MKLLLDTQAFLWFVAGDTRLSARARRRIEDPRNERFLSIASIWEIAIKLGLGKLRLDVPPDSSLRDFRKDGTRPGLRADPRLAGRRREQRTSVPGGGGPLVRCRTGCAAIGT